MSDTLDRQALETAHAAAMYEVGAHIHEDAIAAGIAAYLAASPQPANPMQVTEIRARIEEEHAKVSGDDGYNYAAGHEYGLRQALIIIDAAIGAGGQAVAAEAEWHQANGAGSILFYTLRQDGWRKGDPVMVNDITVRIEAANGSKTPIKPVADRILTALSQPHPADERVEPTDGVSNKAEEGRQAYKSGQSKDGNPYQQGTARYWQWSSGWLDEQAFRPRPDERVVEALRAKVEEIRARVEKTICPTFSSDSGDIGEQGRISRGDFDTLVISALGRAS